MSDKVCPPTPGPEPAPISFDHFVYLVPEELEFADGYLIEGPDEHVWRERLLALTQGAWGGWMALHGGQPTRGWLHMLYGAVAVLWIPAIQLLNRKRSGRDATLTCALVSFAEFVIALRAMATS